jgi:H+-transporting ATPase
MSTPSSNPHASITLASPNEGNLGSSGHHDVEQGDLETEKRRYTPNSQGSVSLSSENLAHEPDEYIRLLKFIDIEAKKEKHGRDRDGGDGEEQEMRRLWYTPWKKVPAASTGVRRVPQSWLDTNMSQGLSETEIIERRTRFGYNELERYATQTLAFKSKYLSYHA